MSEILRLRDYRRREERAPGPAAPQSIGNVIILPVVRIERFPEQPLSTCKEAAHD